MFGPGLHARPWNARYLCVLICSFRGSLRGPWRMWDEHLAILPETVPPSPSFPGPLWRDTVGGSCHSSCCRSQRGWCRGQPLFLPLPGDHCFVSPSVPVLRLLLPSFHLHRLPNLLLLLLLSLTNSPAVKLHEDLDVSYCCPAIVAVVVLASPACQQALHSFTTWII